MRPMRVCWRVRILATDGIPRRAWTNTAVVAGIGPGEGKSAARLVALLNRRGTAECPGRIPGKPPVTRETAVPTRPTRTTTCSS